MGSGGRMISVEGIGKRYRLGGPKAIDLRGGLRSNLRRLTSGGDRFWALRDVSFEVKEGEALGIIGRNGAGKTTLLRILSRITFPTEGRFSIEGRVSSLLEVGTGFHPELSGRENIYLNGTILGMRRAEVRRKFDEIVEFSGVERFLDNAVKHYSNGQKVRLAFAVAAHLEPEVLIIDEVLAVGDVEFQRKCLGKMKDVASHGRTVLFVSHNMSAINSLCQRCLLLDDGRIESMGDPAAITTLYLGKNNAELDGEKDLSDSPVSSDGAGRFLRLRWTDETGRTIDHARVSQGFNLQVDFEIAQPGYKPQPVALLYNSKGEQAFMTFAGEGDHPTAPGRYRATLHFPRDLFNADTYYVSFWFCTWLPHKVHFVLENAISIKVLDDLESPTRAPSHATVHGILRPKFQWEIGQL